MRNRLRRLLRSGPSPTLSSLEAYARWAAHYPPYAHNALMRSEEAAMRALLPDLHDRCVLDLACGTGRYSLLAQSQGAACVVGIDHSPDMLAANPHPRRAQATIDAIPLPRASMHVVVCGLALGHLAEIGGALREICRVLTPDGLALISDLHPAVARAGGQRTFTGGDGKTYAVEHHLHEQDEVRRMAAQAGLKVVEIAERSVENAPAASPAVIVYALVREGQARLPG